MHRSARRFDPSPLERASSRSAPRAEWSATHIVALHVGATVDRMREMPHGRFADHVVLVTGAGSALGQTVASEFASEGARVVRVVHARRGVAGATDRDIDTSGTDELVMHGDIGDAGVCTTIVERVRKRHGRIDVVVNVAHEEHADAYATFELTRQALSILVAGGSVVNTASPVGATARADHALVGLTRALSQRLAKRQIRVNAVAVPSDGSGIESRQIARLVLYLAGPHAAGLTGEVIAPTMADAA